MFASQANLKIANYHFRRLETEHEAVLGFVKTKVIMQGKLVAVVYTPVNTNLKYKEDDFTDSNAVAFSQEVFIHFLHVAPTCQTPLIRFPPHPSITHPSSVRFRELSQ